MKRFLCSAVISMMPSILLVPQAARSADDGLCFLRTASGRIIGLDALCLRRSQKKPMWKVTTDLDPRYVTRKLFKGGESIDVKPGADVSFQLPDGSIVEPDLTITNANGLRYRAIFKGEKMLGLQYFRPDGSPAEPNEALTLPNGQTVVQMKF
jgi:hypothetical protein